MNIATTGANLAPLYRSTFGIDRLADALFRSGGTKPSYPPYNVEKTGDNAYRVSLEVAGFTPDELNVETRDRRLVITGRHEEQETGDKSNFLFRGIAKRSFEWCVRLAANDQVVGAKLENGLLHVELVHEIPEAMKPNKIEIKSGSAN